MDLPLANRQIIYNYNNQPRSIWAHSATSTLEFIRRKNRRVLPTFVHERGCIASSRCKTIKPQKLQIYEQYIHDAFKCQVICQCNLIYQEKSMALFCQQNP